MTSQNITTYVIAVEQVAENVYAYTLACDDRSALPAFSAGAHIDLLLGNDLIRQYSLCSEPANRHQYQVAIMLEAEGRGGSAWIHKNLQQGSELKIHAPRNHFELNESLDNYLLIAGGIGITPIMLMATRLKQLNKPFTLHYLSRTPEQAAFTEQLSRQLGDQIQCHYSYGESNKRLNIDALFNEQAQSTEVYTCGSERLLQSILEAAEDKAHINVIYERFSTAPIDETIVNSSFEIELASSGKVIEILPEQSILEVLRAEGHTIETMCEEGLCGSCEIGLLEGDADHRDSVLTADEQAEQSVLMVCCSRANSARLKLDL
ncbi:MAG: PDR/VanB family oxidoreductase [Ostreibacterium sp.]